MVSLVVIVQTGHNMDSANADISAVLQAQCGRIHGHEERLTWITMEIQEMVSQQQRFQALVSEQIYSLREACQQLSRGMGNLHMAISVPAATLPLISTPPPATILVPDPTLARMLHLLNLSWFSGDSEKCRSFLVQCALHGMCYTENSADTFP